MEEFKQKIQEAFEGTIQTIEVVSYRLPQSEGPVDVEIHMEGLWAAFPDAQVLAVTNQQLSHGPDFLFGGAHRHKHVAIASTSLLRESESKTIRRLLTVAIHEVGHLLGLEHHGTELRAPQGFCPMTKAEVAGPQEYVRKVIDQRALQFCPICRGLIRVSSRKEA